MRRQAHRRLLCLSKTRIQTLFKVGFCVLISYLDKAFPLKIAETCLTAVSRPRMSYVYTLDTATFIAQV